MTNGMDHHDGGAVSKPIRKTKSENKNKPSTRKNAPKASDSRARRSRPA